MSFIFGGNTGITYDDLQRRRKNAQAIMEQQTQPTDFWSGLGAIGQAFIGRNARNKADKAIADRGMQFKDAISSAMSKDMGLDDRLRSLSSISSDANYSQDQRDYAKGELDYWRSQGAPKDRKMVKGADGYQYYQDDGSRVLPDVQTPTEEKERKIIKGADGYQYFQDDGTRVLPDIEMQAAAPDYGATPIHGVIDGELVVGQLNSQGGVRWNNVSDDDQSRVQVVRPTKTIDTGTGTAIVNSMTGEQQGEISKNLSAAEAQKATGRIEGETQALAAAELSTDIENAENAISVIDQTLNHPGLAGAVGNIQGLVPGTIAGAMNEDVSDFLRLSDQIQGKAFLQAFETLKGGGQITEVEGKKATDAIARLSRAQSEPAFKAALTELKGIIKRGVQRARAKAGQGSEADIMAKYGIK